MALQVFNDEEEEVDYKKIDNTNELINILEIAQLKFSSDSFQITVYLRQMMVFKKKEYFKKCLIKVGSNVNNKSRINDKTDSVDDKTDSVDDKTDSVDEDKEVKEEVKEVKEVKEDMVSEVVETNDVNEESNKNNDTTSDMNGDDYNNNVDIDSLSHQSIEEFEETLVNSNAVSDNKSNKPVPNESEHNKSNETELDETNQIFEPTKDLDNLELQDVTDLFDAQISGDKLIIKKPNEVYKELYFKAKQKAKRARNEALKAHLEAKNIKQRYLLDELIDSDTESDSEYETDSGSNNECINYSDE